MDPRDPAALPDQFGDAVRRLRQRKGWSQEELADRAGLHRTYVGGIERGERNVSLVNIGRLARALETSLSALMDEVATEAR
jgi:transcriptional regulator with XRE-family HTH domain